MWLSFDALLASLFLVLLLWTVHSLLLNLYSANSHTVSSSEKIGLLWAVSEHLVKSDFAVKKDSTISPFEIDSSFFKSIDLDSLRNESGFATLSLRLNSDSFHSEKGSAVFCVRRLVVVHVNSGLEPGVLDVCA